MKPRLHMAEDAGAEDAEAIFSRGCILGYKMAAGEVARRVWPVALATALGGFVAGLGVASYLAGGIFN